MDSYRVPARRDEVVHARTDLESDRHASWLTRIVATVIVVFGIATTATLCTSGESRSERRWTFLDDAGDPAALGFHAGASRAGAWSLEDHDAATGARALVNHAGDDDAPPATLLAGALKARDVRASTRCKTDSHACGLVFRFADEENHHVARLDVAEQRVVLTVVARGHERVLGAGAARVEPGIWQELTVLARGDEIRVSCNARDVVVVTDPTPARFGGVGLWVPASAEAHFDELVVETLPASPQSLEVLPLLRKGAT